MTWLSVKRTGNAEMSKLIQRALAGATDTRIVLLAPGAVSKTAEVFKELFDSATAIIIADERTMATAGTGVVESLRLAGVPMTQPHIFPAEPELYASYDNCKPLINVLSGVDAVAVVIGSGTLNDLVKRASAELGRPYLVVASAASMDGYTAFGASIAVDGFKQTLSCPAPKGCICDLEIMARAPQVMTASGFGDLLGKVPAGADWILADALNIEPMDHQVWDLVQKPLRHALEHPSALARGEIAAIGDLSEGLVMSGLAMQAHKTSRPASGAEHQFSHLWEMEGHGVDTKPRRLSHGFKVGIGTLAVASLYEALLKRDLTRLDIDQIVAGWPTRQEWEQTVRRHHTAPALVEETVVQATAKWITAEELADRLNLLVRIWPELSQRLAAQLIPAAQLSQLLAEVGAPTHPKQIGIGRQRFKDTYLRAQMIRKRYTVLDLALETNLLGELVDELFAPDGFWGGQAVA